MIQDLLLEIEKLNTQRGKARTGTSDTRWSLGSATICSSSVTLPSDRRDNAELGEMRSDRINHRDLLPDEQMTGPVKHQAALLLRRLGWHEPHVGSGDRLANRFRVSHVVLLSFDVRLHVSWRHQSHSMANACSSRDQW